METQEALEALLLTEIATLQETRDESLIQEQEGVQETLVQVTQEVEEEPTTSPLHHIRQDPGRIGLATMLEEMAKLRRIRELKLPENLFPGLARKVLMIYRNRASIEEPSRLRTHHPAKRLTLLAILCMGGEANLPRIAWMIRRSRCWHCTSCRFRSYI